MRSEYEIYNKKTDKIFIIDERFVEDMIKICENRNNKYHDKWIDIWEHLEQNKYNPDKKKNGSEKR